jgi:hypothetical protein
MQYAPVIAWEVAGLPIPYGVGIIRG